MPPVRDLTGMIFHRWTVLRRVGSTKNKKTLWECRCECGGLSLVVAGNLTRKLSTQCRGCGDTPKPRSIHVCTYPACGREYQPLGAKSRYCSPECKAKHRWEQIAADPDRRRQHCERVCSDHKKQTYTTRQCVRCRVEFHGPPLRQHCSRECLDATIASGKYRFQHVTKKATAKLALIAKELEKRNDGNYND